jgi:hypothetical protein
MDSYNSPTTRPILRASQIVWYILGILEVLLVFRFLLKLFGANAAAGFTSFVYGISWLPASPFLYVFPASAVPGGTFEWTTLLAMFVYWLVVVGIVRLLVMSKTVSTPEAAHELEKKG